VSKPRLGKTKDSRTRGRKKAKENQDKIQQLKEELKKQKEFTDYLLMKGYSTSTTRRYVKDVEMFIQWVEKENIPIERATTKENKRES